MLNELRLRISLSQLTNMKSVSDIDAIVIIIFRTKTSLRVLS